MRLRGSTFTGGVLLLAGCILLLNQWISGAWSLFIIGTGAVFLASAFIYRQGGLAIPGGLILAAGLILGYQAVTRDWASWAYLWGLMDAALGLGFLLAGGLGVGGARFRRLGWAWLLLGLAAAGLFWFLRRAGLFHWAQIIVAQGVLFLLAGLVSRVTPLAIPGSIITAVGLLLYWQALNNQFGTWAFAWVIVPAATGAGLLLGGFRSRAVHQTGWHLLGWSLFAGLAQAIFFMPGWNLVRFWPLLLILFGLWLMGMALFKKGSG